MMITCMILIGKRNSRIAMTVAFGVGGIGSAIASAIYWLNSIKENVWGWTVIGLIGAAIMAIGMIGVYGSHKSEKHIQEQRS